MLQRGFITKLRLALLLLLRATGSSARADGSWCAFYDFSTQRTMRVFDLESRPAREVTGLAVSQDGRSILYTQLDALSRDIVLVDNFR